MSCSFYDVFHDLKAFHSPPIGGLPFWWPTVVLLDGKDFLGPPRLMKGFSARKTKRIPPHHLLQPAPLSPFDPQPNRASDHRLYFSQFFGFQSGFMENKVWKAKSIFDNESPKQSNAHSSVKLEEVSFTTSDQFEYSKKNGGCSKIRDVGGLDRVTSYPLNQIGETIWNALEEKHERRKVKI
ncbi:unnamed protein product [Lactuca saligna]|uniref:Uncharacterized protein n=1 Tax=Lactuca saligna TaxID=75948 RepID=A0AA35YGM7_LACSI|nr:unnamed protein product [Lactuca saligna]